MYICYVFRAENKGKILWNIRVIVVFQTITPAIYSFVLHVRKHFISQANMLVIWVIVQTHAISSLVGATGKATSLCWNAPQNSAYQGGVSKTLMSS